MRTMGKGADKVGTSCLAHGTSKVYEGLNAQRYN